MPFVISSVIPFPNILWWCKILQASSVIWEMHEYFEKMTYRNRYYIAGGNGLMKLSLPIQGGREHKLPVNQTMIAAKENWQKQHWRTIVSAYNNAPYFDYYASSLEKLFLDKYEKLADFNLSTIQWLKQQLNVSFSEDYSNTYTKEQSGVLYDLRSMKPGLENCTDCDYPTYYQVFQERTGFIPNLSLLDLLFAEGPFTTAWIKENQEAIITWSNQKDQLRNRKSEK